MVTLNDRLRSSIFSAHAFDGSTVIGVLDPDVRKLSCYQIVGDQITVHLWTRPALSAVAVEATRKGQRDILILEDGDVLQLWTGFSSEFVKCHVDLRTSGRSTSGNVPSRTPAPVVDMNTGTDDSLHILELRDAVENRANMVLNDNSIIRAQLDFTVRSSLVQECLDAISYAMPVDIMWDLKHRYFQLQHGRDYESLSSKDEWGDFTATLLSYCDTGSFSALSKPTVSDWDYFLDSDMHRLLGNHPAFRDEPLMLPVSTSNPYSEMIIQAQKLARHHFRGPATRQTLRLDYFYKFILVALHLVHEERSINQATFNEGDMLTLLTLMAHVVRWSTWVDTYSRRDFTKTKGAQLPGTLILQRSV